MNPGPAVVGLELLLALGTAACAQGKAVGLTAGWLYSASNQELQPIVAFLNAHKIGIEIEAPALQARHTCGSGVEGYVPFGLPGGRIA